MCIRDSLDCIEQIAKEPENARKMASVGRAFALDRFSIQRLVEEMNLLYQTLLAKRRVVISEAVRESEKADARAADSLRVSAVEVDPKRS